MQEWKTEDKKWKAETATVEDAGHDMVKMQE